MIKIKYVDEVSVRLETDRGTLQEISDRFAFKAANYQHMPKYKAKIWDGNIRLLDARTNLLPSGLVEDLIEYIQTENYDYSLDNGILYNRDITMESVHKFFDSLNVPDEMKEKRTYQMEAFLHAMKKVRAGFLSPTSSGKSFIIYMIMRFMMLKKRKTLIIVPTVNLVKQMAGDFTFYNRGNAFDIHEIMEGTDKSLDKDITISTWHSLKGMPPKFLQKFDCVMVDEVHGAEAAELKKILNSMSECKYRYGFTGTMRDTITNRMALEGHFGKFNKVITLEELKALGFISDLDIKITILKYTEEEKKYIRNLKNPKKDEKVTKQSRGAKAYADEQEFIDAHQKRNEFIVKYADTLKGNVLILFKRVDKHGKILFDMIKAETDPSTTDAFIIHGKIHVDDREEIRKRVDDPKQKKKVIISASMGAFSTGANMKKIRHIIFVASSKSNVTVMQSIGRGLRLDGIDNEITLHDFSDDFRSSSYTNSSMKHLIERINMYDKEKFSYKITSYKL